jgi:hypothetical protein
LDRLRDVVQDIMKDRVWRDLFSSRKDAVTGEQASVAKNNPSGEVAWSSPDGLMAGLSAAAYVYRARFVNHSDVIVTVKPYSRLEAVQENKPSLLSGGHTVTVEGKTRDGYPWSVGAGIGLDAAGRGTVGVTFTYGPKDLLKQ